MSSNVCNVTAHNGHSRSTKVFDFVTNRKRVCDFLVMAILSCFAPFRRYGSLKVENRPFVPTALSFNALIWGDDWWLISNFGMNVICTRMQELKFLESSSFPSVKKWCASFVRFDTIPDCDGRTDRHLCCDYTSAYIVCYATALVVIAKHWWRQLSE